MSYAAILAQIKSTIEGVSAVGVVLDYDPHHKDWGDKINVFRHSDNKINGASIRRVAVPAGERTVGRPPREVRTHVMSIHWLYEIVGDGIASTAIVDAGVEAIQEAFRNNHTLGSTCNGTTPLSGDAITDDEFGNVWCHSVEMSMEVRENIG